MAIEHADFEGVERLALVTGGEITGTFDAPDKVKIGRCEVIEEIMIGEDKVSSGCAYDHTLTLCSSSSSLVSPLARRARSCFAVQRRKWLKRPNDPCTMPSLSCPKPSRRLV